jgi:hypothetical protein
MIFNYNEYIIEKVNIKGILFIEKSEEEDGEWKLSIDISDIFNLYNDQDFIKFNQLFNKKITENLDNISNINEYAWSEIQPELEKLKQSNTIKESNNIYNKLYDLFDEYEIEIKNNNEQNETR